jgi:hypothetical protein
VVTKKNAVFWDVTLCGSCKNRRFGGIRSGRRLLVTDNVVPSSPILVTLMMEACVSPKRRFLQDSHGVTSQKMAFFSKHQTKLTPWPLVRKRTIPTERPPLVGEI